MRQSASTTRSRLRVARAMANSHSLSKACESGRLTHERALRIARIIKHYKPTETIVNAWVDHTIGITIKRLDDEIRAITRQMPPAKAPSPPSDQEWFESIHRAPGDARSFLLKQSISQLSKTPAADVFLKLNLPIQTATELRTCIREAQDELLAQCTRTRQSTAAMEVRQRPSDADKHDRCRRTDPDQQRFPLLAP